MLGIILLFLFAFLPGMFMVSRETFTRTQFKFILTFSGAYLLTLICSHLLPDLFSAGSHNHDIGLWVVIGLFGQMVLEGFTKGVEHGHVHSNNSNGSGGIVSGISIVLALSIHALVEGTMLIQTFRISNQFDGYGLMAGILVHKIPASIALAMVLKKRMSFTNVAIFLMVFSLMSPIGLYMGDYLHQVDILSLQGLQILFGLASGSLLYISFTIIFEARKDHGFRLKETLPAILGALVAITMNWGIL